MFYSYLVNHLNINKMLIAVINTDEQPIEAIVRILGDSVIDNEDGESFFYEDVEYCYYQREVKLMPIREVTLYEISKCVN